MLPDNLQEASFDLRVKVRVARSPVGPRLSHSFSPSSKVLEDSQSGMVLPPASKSLSDGLGKSLKLSPVCFHCKSSSYSQLKDVNRVWLSRVNSRLSRDEEMHSSSPQSSSSLEDGTEPFQVCATPLFSSVPGDPYGHAVDWRARSRPFQVSSRDLVSSPQSPPYHWAGSDGGFVCLSGDSYPGGTPIFVLFSIAASVHCLY